MLRLVTFGGLSVENGTPANGAANVRSRLAVVAVIAAAGDRGVRREKLMALFWPDSDDERARNALRQALFAMRRDLGGAELTLGTTDLRLNPQGITSDIGEFEAAFRDGRLADAVALYRGPFLDGVYLKELPEFDRWAEEQRARLSADYGRALERLAVAATQPGDVTSSAEWWGRAAAHDRFSTRIARAYMEALLASGDREAAIRHAAHYASVVREELEAEPDADLLAFAQQLRGSSGGSGGPIPLAATGGDAWSRPAAAARSRMPRSVTSRILLSLGVLALLALPVASMLRPAPPARPLESKRVLVTAFENRTGDASLDQLGGLAADWIADGLLRSGTVEVIDPVTAYYAVRDVQADKSISHDNSGRLRALGEAGSAGMVVWGAIDAVSDSVVFVVRVSDVEAGRLLETFRVAVPAVLAATAGVSTLREVVAGSVAAHSDSTLGALVGKEFAPPRLEAYREFRRGLDHFRPLRYREALDAFLTAARLDSTFTLPLVWAAYAAGNVRAWATRDSLEEVMRGILDRDKGRFSPLDRLALVSFTAHDGSARQEAIVEAARLAPGSNWTYLSGRNGWRLGPAIAALEAVDRRRGWAAGWMWVYHELARAYHFAGDYDRQLAVTREYAALYPWRRDAVRWLEVTALAALGREAELDRLLGVIEAGYDTSQVGWAPDQLMIEAGRELRAHGRNAAAELFLARADRWIEAHRATLDTLSFRYWRAKTDVAFYRERWEEAERLYRQVLEDSGDRGWWAVVQLSVVAALQGRRDEALKLWDEYLKRWPPPRRTERLFRARVSAALGEGDEAVRFFSEAVTLTEGVGGARTHLEVPYLHGPEWRRIANHPGYRALFKR